MPSRRVRTNPVFRTSEKLEAAADPGSSAVAIAKTAYRFWSQYGAYPFRLDLLADDAAIALDIAQALRRMPLLFGKTITLLRTQDGRRRIEISTNY